MWRLVPQNSAAMDHQTFDICIISLAGEHPRKAFQRAQMARLGLEARFMDAATPQSMPAWVSARHDDAWARPLRPTELALTHSHRQAWEAAAAQERPTLVLEDDVILAPSTPLILAALAARADLEFVQLETFNNPKLLGAQTQEIGVAPFQICPLYRDRGGAAAGLIWPAAARKLVASVEDWYPPADAAIDLAPALRRHQVSPACAVQAMNFPADMTWPEGMDAIAPSIVSANPRPKHRSRGMWLRQKCRRLAVSYVLWRNKRRAGRDTVTRVIPFVDG